jgi:hypothetical protein
MTELTQHWLIRVGDGINFKNSKKNIWCLNNSKKTLAMLNKFNENDVLWFISNKTYDNIILGMAHYKCYFIKTDEPLININTYSNDECGFDDNNDYDIQIHYTKFYNTERQQIQLIFKCMSPIINYNNNIQKINVDLISHYINYLYYAEPIR